MDDGRVVPMRRISFLTLMIGLGVGVAAAHATEAQDTAFAAALRSIEIPDSN